MRKSWKIYFVAALVIIGIVFFYFAATERYFDNSENDEKTNLNSGEPILHEQSETYGDVEIISTHSNPKVTDQEVQKFSEDQLRSACQGEYDISEHPPFGEDSYRIDGIGSGSIFITKYQADVYKKYCLPEYEKTIEYINQGFPIPSEVDCQRLSILDGGVCVLKDIGMYDIGSIGKIKFYISTSPQDFIIELHGYAFISGDVYYVKYMDDSYYEKRQKEIETNMKNEYALQGKDDRKDPYDSTTTNFVVNDQGIYQYSLEIAKKIATVMENIF